MCLATARFAKVETPEVALLRIPNGRPRTLLLSWLDELLLVVELLELLFEPKSELKMLFLVVEESVVDVVRASPAMAEWSKPAKHARTTRIIGARRRELEVWRKEGREFMRRMWFCLSRSLAR